ncbi:MAG TPA: DUF4160 domain-containing protein [Thermoanaerobaculia bacterium]|nr:DUF4160 domain-containing protein [Thermoanaerobaculia bacterium]
MPRIAEFYGIAIYMYYGDHAPPHFHAIYGRSDLEVEISTGRILKGKLPRRAERFVRSWYRRHQRELARNWHLARAGRRLRSIPPLE